MNDKEKKYKNAKVTLLIKLLITIKMLKIFFIMHQKLIKKIKIKDRKKYCRKDKIKKTKIEYNCKKRKEKINNTMFNYYFDYWNPEIIFKKLRDASDEKNKNMVKSINKKLTKMKNTLKNVPKDEVSKVKENEKIIDIEKKQGSGLKILKLNQMLT